nr:3-ketoacyl-CoA thiolase 2, peroxisomal [Tanacetum cinerariifolium]
EDNGRSSRLSSSNGGYIRKCFTTPWHDEEGIRPGYAGYSFAYQRNTVFGDDVVVVAGGLKDPYPDEILAPVLKVKTMAEAQDCLLPMGVTSENVSQRLGMMRKEQDQATESNLGTKKGVAGLLAHLVNLNSASELVLLDAAYKVVLAMQNDDFDQTEGGLKIMVRLEMIFS